MLSAHKLGPKGVEYYVSYAGRGAEGYWLGKAAASLGLVGAVDPAAFRALAKGEHPDGGRLLERVATDHTPGWDLTLSAPKSVSLAWALADEPLRAALAEAHRGAVKAAFSFLEDEGGRARRGFGGRDGHVACGARHRLLCPPRLARARSAAPHAWDRLQRRRRKRRAMDRARLPHDLPAPTRGGFDLSRRASRASRASSVANGLRRTGAACPSSRALTARCCAASRSGGTRSRRSSSAPGDRGQGRARRRV